MERPKIQEEGPISEVAQILLILGTAYYAVSQLKELNRRNPIWKLKSKPRHSYDLDRLFRTLTNPIMELAGDEIIAHAWDFQQIEAKDNIPSVTIARNPKAFPRNNVTMH